MLQNFQIQRIFQKNLLMFRKTYSPYTSRASSYLEALERDEMVNTLRRQYSQFKTLEAEYDDLKYQIGKMERENKKLEDKNTEVQEDYLDKIKGNKSIIHELTQHIQQIKKQMEEMTMQIQGKQKSNEDLIDEVKKTKISVEKVEIENKELQHYITEQQDVITDLKNTIIELETKKKQIQENNKKKSTKIDNHFEDHQKTKEKLKNEQNTQGQLKKELTILKQKKAKLEDKRSKNQTRIQQLQKKYDQHQFESEKLGKKAFELDKQMANVFGDSLNLKDNLNKSLKKNRQNSERLKMLETILKDNVNGLYSKKLKKEQLLVELADLNRNIEKTEGTISVINQQIIEQEANHTGLISNLKKSIQSDEEAVKALTRKASILNLISH